MKKDTKEYGGYSNYPTWATSLWIDLEIKEESDIANTLGKIINQFDLSISHVLVFHVG